jgi:phosphatidate cytidylyltransferase
VLRQRLITAFILAPLTVGAVLFLPTVVVGGLLALVISVGAWEWSALVHLQGVKWRLLYVIVVLLLLAGSYYLSLVGVAVVGLVWWIGCTIVLKGWAYKSPSQASLLSMPIPGLLAGILVLVPAWRATVGLHALPLVGPAMVLFLFVLVWLADSAAYLVGRRFGHTPLAPALSPGKTWEGLYGALAVGSLFSLIGGGVFAFSGSIWWGFVGLGLVTLLASVVGDLLESLFKRLAAVKDSGHLLPGHGGVLDRVDSLTAAAPIFALGIWLLERLQ